PPLEPEGRGKVPCALPAVPLEGCDGSDSGATEMRALLHRVATKRIVAGIAAPGDLSRPASKRRPLLQGDTAGSSEPGRRCVVGRETGRGCAVPCAGREPLQGCLHLIPIAGPGTQKCR